MRVIPLSACPGRSQAHYDLGGVSRQATKSDTRVLVISCRRARLVPPRKVRGAKSWLVGLPDICRTRTPHVRFARFTSVYLR